MIPTRPHLPLDRSDDERLLHGWGRTVPVGAHVHEALDGDRVADAVRSAGPRGVLVRGLGRSYGDAAQDSGGTVLDLTPLAGIHLDPAAATVTAGAGASLDAILRAIVPAGFFVPVTPGTRMVTVGGAIAADVHGKNHHRDGTFGAHVRSMTLVDGRGQARDLEAGSDEFWATVGGMGLTGAILEAAFDVIPIETSLMSVDTERCADLDEVMASMAARDADYRYSVAWIDSVAASGRGVITRGDHAPLDALPAGRRAAARDYAPRPLATVPAVVPSGLLSPLTVRLFNEAWFRRAPRSRIGELQSIAAFFHPLDGVRDWNRVYGPAGFLQYQFVVPDAAAHVVGRVLDRLRAAGAPSFLTVLKRFGPANPGFLSFPSSGWTLAADVPAGIDGLGRVLDDLDEEVLSAGGRFYLAKDSRMDAAALQASYPLLGRWREVRDRMDPDHVFQSDLARRLSLC